MQVKCKYCGSWIDDSAEQCPNCGAVNDQLKRFVNITPKTIEELKQWYIDRNLPDENITRFFIGKDIKEPKAFGIYKDGSNFIVYKNKADGSRAIRYKGKDESYAVNEIFLKLKEEILNQKNHNIIKRNSAVHNSVNDDSIVTGKLSTDDDRYKEINSYKLNDEEQNNNRSNNILSRLIISISFIILVGSLLITVGKIVTSFNSNNWVNTQANQPKSLSYYYNNEDLYYYTSSNTWWKYDFKEYSWNYFIKYDDYNTQFPTNITAENKQNLIDICKKVDIAYNILNIYHSKNFVDAENHPTPSKGYYKLDDHIYYYLSDNYGYSYGSRDNSGWYSYNNDTDNWIYYANKDDKEKLGDDLYYYASDYYIDDVYSFSNDPNSVWYVANFNDTEWYHDYETARENYNKQEQDDNDSWNNNDSWNWDSNDDWNADWGDWDSDW